MMLLNSMATLGVLMMLGTTVSVEARLAAPTTDPTVTTKTVEKGKSETVYTGDGTQCFIVTVKNKSQQTGNHVEVNVTYAGSSTPVKAGDLDPGESVPITCNSTNITVKAVGADAEIEVTVVAP